MLFINTKKRLLKTKPNLGQLTFFAHNGKHCISEIGGKLYFASLDNFLLIVKEVRFLHRWLMADELLQQIQQMHARTHMYTHKYGRSYNACKRITRTHSRIHAHTHKQTNKQTNNETRMYRHAYISNHTQIHTRTWMGLNAHTHSVRDGIAPFPFPFVIYFCFSSRPPIAVVACHGCIRNFD